MITVASIIHIPIDTLLLLGAIVLSVLSVYFIYAGLVMIHDKLSEAKQNSDFRSVISPCIAAAFATVFLVQFMIDIDLFSMGYFKLAVGALIVFVAILSLYCLSGKVILSIFLGASIFMVLSTIGVYLYSFRGRLFEPVDIFSAHTAMNVVGNYNLLPIPSRILLGWGILGVTLFYLHRLQPKQKVKIPAKTRLVLLIVCAIASVSVFFYASAVKTYHWDKEGALYNGYILDFLSKFKEISAPKPDNYSTELIDGLADRYSNTQESAPTKPPHLIVIMDEAFSDLGVAGEFTTNKEVMPFISSLQENTISGYALSSVYGGNTANSEYEFLTGNSLAWLSPNVVPYQQYVRSSTYSMVSYLKSSFGYQCIAMHPYLSSGWNRPIAYEHLGFDECYFVEDYPQENYVRDYISDQESFEFLIQTYEAQKEEPLFLFNVTMQNHGGYLYDRDNFTQHISLHGLDQNFPDVEQYLSLIHETDKAVEYLINYFQGVDEEVVIVFFGDHQPMIKESFYTAISGGAPDTLDQRQKRYMVPFFIWANYDIEEQQVDCTSLNYLSSYFYEVAGIPLPPYSRFLREMEAVIPSINANGYYSLANGRYMSFDEASGDELLWLERYEALQYNNLFDTKNRNEEMFPVLD
jgi:phosphoglycerol transferase MdoB-like AlkP superfamily enzyme